MRKSHIGFIWILISVVTLSGCAETSSLSQREKGALLGAGLGAGLGAIVGNQSGNSGAGTAIGAAAGALTGALVGESQRRSQENAKNELRQELLQQQYQGQYSPQPFTTNNTVQQAQPVQAATTGEVHTKYNPRTGQTFPDRFQFDPNTGEPLQKLR